MRLGDSLLYRLTALLRRNSPRRLPSCAGQDGRSTNQGGGWRAWMQSCAQNSEPASAATRPHSAWLRSRPARVPILAAQNAPHAKNAARKARPAQRSADYWCCRRWCWQRWAYACTATASMHAECISRCCIVIVFVAVRMGCTYQTGAGEGGQQHAEHCRDGVAPRRRCTLPRLHRAPAMFLHHHGQ